jgi:two-component system cell cycle response regulator
MKNTILVIDDTESIRQSICGMLENVPEIGSILTAEDGLLGFKILREHSIDLVLCDLIMPDIDGFKFLGLKASSPELDDIPVILLTGREDVDSKVRALNTGASDYVTKPCNPAELVARVRVHLQIKQLQDALRKKNTQLERLTKMDPLTNLANRRHFMDTMVSEFARLERYDRPMSFVMMDLDHFKTVNDEYGHQAGDKVLIVVASILSEAVRANDIVSRYGGEEFAVLLPESSGPSAYVVAERCRNKIEEVEIVFEERKIQVTGSFGLVSLPDDRVSSVKELIALTDASLYTSKHEGRNRITRG